MLIKTRRIFTSGEPVQLTLSSFSSQFFIIKAAAYLYQRYIIKTMKSSNKKYVMKTINNKSE